MRLRTVLILLAVLVPGSYFAGRLANPGGGGAGGPDGRRVLYYVDPMNPSFRSPEPGTAPCGMPLEPVYAGGSAPPAGGESGPGAVSVRADRLQLIGVVRETVRSRTVSQVLRLVGTVAADETRLYTISAATPGRALEMGTATTGSLVTRGQVLGTYYAQELIVPQQNFIRIRETSDALRRTGVNPYDNIQGGTQLAAYERNLLYARQTLLNLGMSPEQIDAVAASREVSYFVQIRAPAAGIVLARKLSLGQSFGVGDELFTIADLGSVWVLADALEGEEHLSTPGLRATVTMPGTGKVFSAVVSRVLPRFEAATRTLKVRLETHNPGFILRPDMFVDVALPVEAGPALFVPRTAVLNSGTRQVIYVEQEPGVFTPRPVRTGRRLGDRVEIVAGIMEGEAVVTSGNFLLDSESRMRTAGARAAPDPTLDPVCGMEVDEVAARKRGLASEHDGQAWFFCARVCKETFDRDPGAATSKEAGRLGPAPGAAPASLLVRPAVERALAAVPDAGIPAGAGEEMPAMPGGAAAMPAGMPPRSHTDIPAGMPGGMPGLERDEGPEDGAVGWQTPIRAPRDPVCGMTVDVGRASLADLVSRNGAETIYFCSAACKKEFDADPSVFVQSSR